MKKYLIPTLAVAAMALSSCSQTELEDVRSSSKVAVSFTTELPKNMASRSISKGETANRLSWAVYHKEGTDWNYVLDDNKEAFVDASTTETVSLSLISGDTYKIVFWADYASSSYTPYTSMLLNKEIGVFNLC